VGAARNERSGATPAEQAAASNRWSRGAATSMAFARTLKPSSESLEPHRSDRELIRLQAIVCFPDHALASPAADPVHSSPSAATRDGKILLVRRKRSPGRASFFPGGRVNSAIAAHACREVDEETGVEVEIWAAGWREVPGNTGGALCDISFGPHLDGRAGSER
jgi:hypothetical protein